MHPCQGNWVAIGRTVVYYARAAHAFSAGIKYRHCKNEPSNNQKQLFAISDVRTEDYRTGCSYHVNISVPVMRRLR